MRVRWIAALAIMVAAGCEGGDEATVESAPAAAATEVQCDEDNGGLTLPAGFCAQVVHEGVGEARHLAVAPNGVVYIALRQAPGGPGDNGIVALRDADGDGRAEEMERFGEFRGTGLEIRGDYLYFATDTSVVRYQLPQDGSLVPAGPPEMVVSDFPVQRSHAAKTLAFDDSGTMWVNVGAPSNNCGGETDRQPGATGQRPCPELERQGGVWRFEADTPGQTQADGERYVAGIRNAMALAYNPADQQLWALQHGRDQLDVVDRENFTAEGNATRPAEELLRLEEGATYSWPYCFYDLESNRRVLTPEYGGTGQEVGECDQYPPAVATFGGHWAPIDLLFYDGDQFPESYRNGAFIAFHGSWNRAPLSQEGYQVMFQPLSGGQVSGEAQPFATGFAVVDPIPGPGEAEHRPVGLAQGPDGSLYISDSVAGRIWRVSYAGGS